MNFFNKHILPTHDNSVEDSTFFKKAVFLTVTVLGGLAFCNVGLTESVKSVLQRRSLLQQDTVGGTDAGVIVTATPNPAYVKGYLQLTGNHVFAFASDDTSFDYFAELASLNDEEPIAHLDMDATDVADVFQGYQEGAPVTVSVEVAGTVHIGHVSPGVTLSQGGGKASKSSKVSKSSKRSLDRDLANEIDQCVVYDNIMDETDSDSIFDQVRFQVTCCGNAPCTVKADLAVNREDGTRRLDHPLAACFSPYSTVVEKNKGMMYMKDLSYGDKIQAAGGKYQEVLFSSHSHSSKSTKFLQIHTKSSESPLEVSTNHLVFLYDKALPVLARDIKVGDLLEGLEGPSIVSKIENVVRKGLYTFVTSDATLFVNGVLASSMTSLDEAGEIVSFDFGLFNVHVHTFASWIYAPMMQFGCSKIDPFYCSQVDDGSGGSMHVFAAAGKAVLEMHPVMRVFFISSWTFAGVFIIMCYYVSLFAVPAVSILGINTLFKSGKARKSILQE